MDKLPPRPDLPAQGTTASESKGKDAVGSDGRRGIRSQGANTNIGKPLSSSDVVKTALKDRLISKPSDTVARQSGVAISNLSKTMAKLRRAVKACAEPGYRVSKSDAVIGSIKALRKIRKQLGDTGQELQLKSQLNDLLGTKIARGRVNMTLSDFGQISKLASTVADAPTMARMEKKTAELLTRALELLTDSAYSRSPKEYTAPVAEQKPQEDAFIGDTSREFFPDGVMPDLDAVDDSEPVINANKEAVIPTPPPPPPLPEKAVIPTPPPPLPEEQVADVANFRSEPEPEAELQPEVRRDYDAVIEELKQKLLAKGIFAESTNPDIMTSSAQVPVDPSVSWPAPDLASVNNAETLKAYDAVIDELKQKLLARGVLVEDTNPETVASSAQDLNDRSAPPQDDLAKTRSTQSSKGHSAVHEELPQKPLANGTPAQSKNAQDVTSSVQSAVDTPVAQQADIAKAKRAEASKGFDAVVEELKEKIRQRGGAFDPDLAQTTEVAAGVQARQASKSPEERPVGTAQQVDVARAKRAEASKGFDAVVEELKERLRQRGGAFDPDLSPGAEAQQATLSTEERPGSATGEQMAALQEQAEHNHAELKEALRARRMAIDPDNPAAEPERNKKGRGEGGQ